MAEMVTTEPLTRRELGEFLPSHRAIVAFENAQKDIASQGDVLTTGTFVLTEEDANFPAAKVLSGSDNIDIDDTTDVVLDLTDTGVAAGDYGEPTRLIVLAIDAKGRVTAASEVKLDVSDVDGLLDAGHGGTGNGAYTIGDLLVATATDTLAPLPDGAVNNVLLSGGVGALPLYGKVDLTLHVTGILPELNGGTGTATPGFTGTGAYTNFTFANGKCTSAS